MLDEKKAYEEKCRAKLDELEARIDVVRAKAQQVKAGAQAESARTANSLLAKVGAVRTQLKELVTSPDDGWTKVKERVEHSYDQLKRELEAISS